jgi:hypothetical protein
MSVQLAPAAACDLVDEPPDLAQSLLKRQVEPELRRLAGIRGGPDRFRLERRWPVLLSSVGEHFPAGIRDCPPVIDELTQQQKVD